VLNESFGQQLRKILGNAVADGAAARGQLAQQLHGSRGKRCHHRDDANALRLS
jgi:hypothetical protein